MTGLRAAAALVTAAALAGCTHGDDNGIVFEREDGSRIEMPNYTMVWCAPWEDAANLDALHVRVGARGTEKPWWRFGILIDEVEEGQRIKFPTKYTENGVEDAAFYVTDREREIFLTSTHENSRGHAVYHEISCEPGETVRFSVDATISSEFHDGPTIRARGEFSGEVSAPP